MSDSPDAATVECVAGPSGHAAAESASLTFAVDGGGSTYVARQYAAYPFHWCRPFRVAGDSRAFATVYTQSCAGGLFQGDDLALSLTAEEGARAHVTTSAATIVHSMPAGRARQRVALHVGPGAIFEYLPDPLILFPDAELHSALRIVLDSTASLMFSDAFLLHDPSGDERPFRSLCMDTTVESADGEVFLRDRYRVTGAALAARLPGLTGGHAAQGTFVAVSGSVDPAALLAAMRTAVERFADAYIGVSIAPGGRGVCARVLATDAVDLRAALHELWSAARFAISGNTAVERRK